MKEYLHHLKQDAPIEPKMRFTFHFDQQDKLVLTPFLELAQMLDTTVLEGLGEKDQKIARDFARRILGAFAQNAYNVHVSEPEIPITFQGLSKGPETIEGFAKLAAKCKLGLGLLDAVFRAQESPFQIVHYVAPSEHAKVDGVYFTLLDNSPLCFAPVGAHVPGTTFQPLPNMVCVDAL